MRLEGIHHITAITGRRARQRRLLRTRARPPARQEDGQPGRPVRLPPLLRRREGKRRAATSPSSSIRARAAAGPAPGWCTASSGASQPRTRSTSGRSGCGDEGIAVERANGHLRFDDPEGLGPELAVAATDDEPLIADHPGDPERGGAPGLRRRTRIHPGPAGEPRLARGLAELRALRGRRVRGARRQARLLLRLRPDARAGHPRRRHRPPRRVGLDHGRARGLARTGDGRRAPRPRRSSTASTSSRSTSASRAACCSRSRRSGRASRPTSLSRPSASGSRSRRTSSNTGTRSSRR